MPPTILPAGSWEKNVSKPVLVLVPFSGGVKAGGAGRPLATMRPRPRPDSSFSGPADRLVADTRARAASPRPKLEIFRSRRGVSRICDPRDDHFPGGLHVRERRLRRPLLALSQRRVWCILWAWLIAWAAPHVVWQHALKLGSSWNFFPKGARLLFSDRGLHLYAIAPNLQIGPLAFLVAEPLRFAGPSHGRYAAVALMTALGPVALFLASRLRVGGAVCDSKRLLLAGLVMLPVWCEVATHFGHLDDVLALLFGLAALIAVERRRPGAAGALLAAAAASKPWAVAFAPLLLAFARPLRTRAALVWLGGLAIAWLPFVLADSGTLRAARFRIPTSASSSLRILGVHATRTPSWDRPAQVLLGAAAAALVTRRGRWPAALLAVIATRLLLDPATKPYYTSGIAVAATVVDLWLTRRRVPIFTASAVLLLYAVRATGLSPRELGLLRAAYCFGVLGVLTLGCLRPSRR